MGLIFTYVLTYGGSLVSLFNPYYGLLVYVIFAIVNPAETWWWSVPQGNYSRTVAIALLVGWMFQGFGNWQLGRAKIVVLSLVGFLIWSMISALQAVDPVNANKFVDNLAKIVLPFVVGITTIDSVDKLKQLAVVIVCSTGFLAYNEQETYFMIGPSEHDNITAHRMAVGAAVAFFLGMMEKRTWFKWICFASAATCVHCVMIHMSRGAMVGMTLMGILTFIIIKKTAGNLAILAIATAVGIQLAGPAVMEEYATAYEAKDKSAMSRFDLWKHMWQETRKDPVLGLGPRGWPAVAHNYGWPPGKEGHGAWQQLAAETGLPGAALILAFYCITVWRLLPAALGRQIDAPPWLRPYAQLVVVATAVWLSEQVFGSFYLIELPYYVTLIGAGALKLATVPVQVTEPLVATDSSAAMAPPAAVVFAKHTDYAH